MLAAILLYTATTINNVYNRGDNSLIQCSLDESPENKPPNLILTQFLRLKYTCGKRAVYNSSSVFTLFHSVIFNSVGVWYCQTK